MFTEAALILLWLMTRYEVGYLRWAISESFSVDGAY